MLAQWNPVVLEAVVRASKRAALNAHEELKDGVYDLATIASIAPWIGIFGTILAIVDSFGHCFGQRSTCIGPVAAGLSESMWFTALGLAVGVIAMWFFRYLNARMQDLDLKMAAASQELLNQLGRFPGRFAVDSPVEARVVPPVDDLGREERLFRRCLFAASAAITLDFLVQYARFDLLSACFYTPITLAACCVVVYPFWSRLLHRRPGALIALGSVLALCWSLAELVLGTHLP